MECVVQTEATSRMDLFLHSRKLTAGGPQNDGLEKVTPLKNGKYWYLC